MRVRAAIRVLLIVMAILVITGCGSGGSSGTDTPPPVANVPPTVTLSAPASGAPGSPISFTASATDPNSADQAAGFTYAWNFGDNSTGAGATATHTYSTAGTYTVSVTATDKNGQTSQPASASIQIIQPVAHVYYVAPDPVSGNGSIESPWGLPDLYTTTSSTVTRGPALTSLQPGDTLYFLAGTYNLQSNVVPGGVWSIPLISPARSGTADDPITLAAYPGAAVTLVAPLASATPVMGTWLNFIRFIGFTIQQTAYGAVTGGVVSPIYISGSNNEVGYCEVIGTTVPTNTDNTSGIRFDPGGNANWVHHCYIHGFIGGSLNQDGIKNYKETNLLIEDNYFTDNNAGVEDKDSGTGGTVNTIYRRNLFSGNLLAQFEGSTQGTTPAAYQIYDNVIDGGFSVNQGSAVTGVQVYNNMIRTSDIYDGRIEALAESSNGYQLQAWNNIVLNTSPSGTLLAFSSPSQALTVGGGSNPVSYLDYNVYSTAPTYLSNSTFLTLSNVQSLGLELHSQVVPAASIFANQTSYVLQPAFQTAGRYGDPVGPRYPIAKILDVSRYGPGSGISPVITQEPQNQSVTAGSLATFTVLVSGSGLFYQWQRSDDGGNSWTNLPAANTALLNLSSVAAADNGAVFRCLISSDSGSVWSDTATLTVNAI